MKCKGTIDARSYSHQALEEIRISAVSRVEAGESPEAAVAGLGMNRRTIYRWLAAYHYGGEADPQRPLYRASQQNPELVENWRDKEYPKIARRCPA